MKSEIHRAFNLVSYNHREVKLKGRKIPKEPKDILNHKRTASGAEKLERPIRVSFKFCI